VPFLLSGGTLNLKLTRRFIDMLFCPNCGNEVSEDTKFCPDCGRPLLIGQDLKGNITYSKALRWISGVFGFLAILGAITGLEYFAESGMVSELIVDLITIAIGIALLLMAIVPSWVRSKFKINLERGSVFGAAVVVLVIALAAASALGPEPPGGWWNY
jgi:hypothetical protein